MLKHIFSLFLFLFTSALHAQTLTIAAAANVSYAMHDIIKAFEKHHPNTKTTLTIGGSGKLTAQILHGAPYDIFLSANILYPQSLYEKKLTIQKPKVYAQGALALLSTQTRDFSLGLAVLRLPEIRHIALANPRTAPYGKASVEALQNAHLYKELKEKFVFGESIAQTLSYTLHAAQIGFIAQSALYAPTLRHFQKNKNWIPIDTKLYTPIRQGVVLLKRAKHNTQAQAFYNFLFSKEAQTIFKHYGYTLP